MFNPKVSIIIPVYNWSNYLWEAVESALNQTYDNIEILVINDGSNDNSATEKVALSYGHKIRYIKKENWWVATALNLGIEKMTWEYFSWLSHDDLYYPNKIEEQIKILDNLEDKNTIISSNVELIDERWKHIQYVNKSYNQDRMIYELLENWVINWCTLLINKNIFEKIWNFNISLKTSQDYELWFRIVKKFKFLHLDKTLVKSRQHTEQDSKSKILLSIRERKNLERFVLKIFSLQEIKKSYWSNLPNKLFNINLKIRFIINLVISYCIYFTLKLKIHKYIAPFWRKIKNIKN